MEIIEQKEFQVKAYQPFYAQLLDLEQQNKELVFDYESTKGNKDARSHVYKLRQSKAALEKTRKEEKAESLRIGKAIDSEAKEIEARIEAMIQVHQVKLDEIEQREAMRISEIKNRIAKIINFAAPLETIGSEDLAKEIAELELIAIDASFAEFSAEAAQAKDARLIHLRAHLGTVKVREAQLIELERLRKEAEERAQKERDEAIARHAAEQAKRDAEKAIEEEKAKAKAELEAAERRRIEAEQAAIRREQEAAARAEAEKIAAVEAEKARAAAAKRAEEARAAAAKRAEEEEQALREANKRHCAEINRSAMNAFIENGFDAEQAKLVVSLIAKGMIPAISIKY